MAYETTGLVCLVSSIGSAPSLWTYQSNDAHGTVDGAGYFDDAGDRGLKVNDVVIVTDLNGGETTLHTVSGVTDGAATVTSATLS